MVKTQNITIKFRNKAKVPPCSAPSQPKKSPARAIGERNKLDAHRKREKNQTILICI